MSRIKNEVREMQTETKSIRDKINNQSLASEIIRDYKKSKQLLQKALLVSIIVNVIIVLLLA